MAEDMERKTVADTAKAIADLAGRLNKDEASFIDVFRACDKCLTSVTGEPVFDEEPEIVSALDQLATAVAMALVRQQQTILNDVMRNIGFRIATGNYGADFFNAIREKQQ